MNRQERFDLTKEKAEHKALLEKAFGISSDHPRAAMLYELAWDFGHAYGLSEVEYFYREMAQLLS